MSKLEQAARQIIVDWDSGIHLHEAITALREALAEQAEQEPVAWWEFNEDIGAWFLAYTFNPKAKTRPLVFGDAAPVRTKDLTDDEIYDVCKDVPFVVIGPDYDLAIARAVIAADREKNK